MTNNLISFPGGSLNPSESTPATSGCGSAVVCLSEAGEGCKQVDLKSLPEAYDVVKNAFVDEFWSDTPELELIHRKPLEEFISTVFPRRNFLSRNRRWASRHPDQDPVPRAIGEVIASCSQAIDVYVRKFIEVDFTAPLFEAANTIEEAAHIAWIHQELTILDYQDITGHSFPFDIADRVFAFCSPVFSWRNGFGRQGVVVIRSSRIVDCVVVEAS